MVNIPGARDSKFSWHISYHPTWRVWKRISATVHINIHNFTFSTVVVSLVYIRYRSLGTLVYIRYRSLGTLVYIRYRSLGTLVYIQYRSPGTLLYIRYRSPGTLVYIRYRSPGTLPMLWAGRYGVRIPAVKHNFVFSKPCRPLLGPTHHLI